MKYDTALSLSTSHTSQHKSLIPIVRKPIETHKTHITTSHSHQSFQLMINKRSPSLLPLSGMKPNAERAFLQVPIFIFAVSGESVLIDESYLSRGLTDMVVAVQLEERRWESEVQCNGKPIYVDLR